MAKLGIDVLEPVASWHTPVIKLGLVTLTRATKFVCLVVIPSEELFNVKGITKA